MGIIADSLNEEQILLARAQRFATDQLQDHPDGTLLPRILQAHQFALAITSQEAADPELITLAILFHPLKPTTITDFLNNEFYPPEKLSQLLAIITELNSAADSGSTNTTPFTTSEAQIAHDALHLATLISGQ